MAGLGWDKRVALALILAGLSRDKSKIVKRSEPLNEKQRLFWLIFKISL